jgi:hypothetical protein
MDPRITEAIRCFKEIYIEGTPLLIRDKSAFLSFVCILTAVEALSGYRYEKGNVEQRFKSFIREYFPSEYNSLEADLWSFRNKMVHAFTPANFALIHNQPKVHLTKTSDGCVILNAENFYQAFQSATTRYFDELASNTAHQAAMVRRLEDLYNGGSIGVFAIG